MHDSFFRQMAATASNKTTSNKDLRYPEIEEQALQFILDSCESSISKYNKFLQARKHFNKELLNLFENMSSISRQQVNPSRVSLGRSAGKWIAGFGRDFSETT